MTSLLLARFLGSSRLLELVAVAVKHAVGAVCFTGRDLGLLAAGSLGSRSRALVRVGCWGTETGNAGGPTVWAPHLCVWLVGQIWPRQPPPPGPPAARPSNSPLCPRPPHAAHTNSTPTQSSTPVAGPRGAWAFHRMGRHRVVCALLPTDMSLAGERGNAAPASSYTVGEGTRLNQRGTLS